MSRFMSTTANTSGCAKMPTAEMQSPITDAGGEPSVADAEEASLIPVPHTTAYRYMQTKGCYPGFAFCRFLPGKIETIIRLLLMVVLVVLISLSELLGINSGGALLIFFSAPVALAMEGIMMLLHFLNPSCFNNRYNIFGTMDMIKCVVIGFIILLSYAVIILNDFSKNNEDRKYYCEESGPDPSSSGSGAPNNNLPADEDCHQLQIIHDLLIAIIVVIPLCLILLLIEFIWDTIYISRHFKLKVPVPRSRPGQHQ